MDKLSIINQIRKQFLDLASQMCGKEYTKGYLEALAHVEAALQTPETNPDMRDLVAESGYSYSKIRKMKHTFKSSSGILFCWYGDFYIRLGMDTFHTLNYAVIQTCQCVHSQRAFDSLMKYDVLVEIDYATFHQIFLQAMQTLEKRMQLEK